MSPQQYAAPAVVTPQVWEYPTLTDANTRFVAGADGPGSEWDGDRRVERHAVHVADPLAQDQLVVGLRRQEVVRVEFRPEVRDIGESHRAGNRRGAAAELDRAGIHRRRVERLAEDDHQTEFGLTSCWWGGGLVRTTLGAVAAATTDRNDFGPAPPVAGTTTTRVSPSIAGSATGSKPPSTTAALTLPPVRRSLMVAVEPLGMAPGGSET